MDLFNLIRKIVTFLFNALCFGAFCLTMLNIRDDHAAMNERIRAMNANGPLISGYVMSSDRIFENCSYIILDNGTIYDQTGSKFSNCITKSPTIVSYPRQDWEKYKDHSYYEMVKADKVLKYKNIGFALFWWVIMAYGATGIIRMIFNPEWWFVRWGAFALALGFLAPLGIGMWNADMDRIQHSNASGLWRYKDTVVTYQRVLIDPKSNKAYTWDDYPARPYSYSKYANLTIHEPKYYGIK